MAGATMPLTSNTVAAFRTAQELSSKEPAQLRRTIDDLESRIASQDVLIEQQRQYIEELTEKLEQQKSKPLAAQATLKDDERLKFVAKIEELLRDNKWMESKITEYEDGFWSLKEIQRQGLDDCLMAIGKLPATAESKALYTRVRRQASAIVNAKKSGKISPINALRQLADLQIEVLHYMIDRPTLTFSSLDRYRGEILVGEFHRDSKLRGLNTAEAQRVLGTVEDKVIHRTQAIRAMKWAASNHADLVKFDSRPRVKARLCKTDSQEAKK